MTTKKPAIPVNKKTAVNTKQVPAPVKKSGTVISTTKKPAVKAAVKPMVQPKFVKAGPGLKVKPVLKQEVTKDRLKKIEVAVKKTGADTKGYQVSTHAKQAAFAAKRNEVKPIETKKLAAPTPVKAVKGIKEIQGKKVAEPAKKPVKAVVAKTAKPATLRTSAAQAKNTSSAHATSPAGTKADTSQVVQKLIAEHLPAQPSNPFVAPKASNPFLPASVTAAPAAAAPALKLPPEMSNDQALAREKLLRNTFKTLVATANIGS